MKSRGRQNAGFTLIELLVVIAIIAILAGLLFPALSRVKATARVNAAKTDIQNFVNAVNSFYSANKLAPAPKAVRTSGSDAHPDFTFGTANLGLGHLYTPPDNKTPGTTVINPPPITVQSNNATVTAILMDMKDWAGSGRGNPSNPHQNQYLSAKRGEGAALGSVGGDGVYRDPWGSPYIVTLDMNYDNRVRDAFYRMEGVSATAPNSASGKNGLTRALPSPQGTSTFEGRGNVMIWSFGPDKYASTNLAADINDPSGRGNKDNILSWQ